MKHVEFKHTQVANTTFEEAKPMLIASSLILVALIAAFLRHY